MKRWMILAAVLGLLMLSGCGKEETTEEPSPFSEAAGIRPEEILLHMDGQKQPAWRYLYWLAKDCAQLQEQYESAGAVLDWDAPLEEGGTLADYVKEQALADTALYAVVEHWAERYACMPEMTDWESEGAKDPLLTSQQAAELEGIGQAYGKLYDLFCTPGSPLAPVEGELEQFAQERGIGEINRILIADKGDRQAARQKAEELFAQLNSASDREETFTALAAAGDDPLGPRALKSDTFEASLQAAAQALEPGQYSGILESAEGFSILRRQPEDVSSLREDYFDSLLQRAAEESRIQTTEAYETLSVGNFYAALATEKRK